MQNTYTIIIYYITLTNDEPRYSVTRFENISVLFDSHQSPWLNVELSKIPYDKGHGASWFVIEYYLRASVP